MASWWSDACRGVCLTALALLAACAQGNTVPADGSGLRRDGSATGRDGGMTPPRDGGGPGTPCTDEGHSSLCATPTDLGTLMPGEEVLSDPGVLPARDDEDWFGVHFPAVNMPNMFGGGEPRVELAMNDADQFKIEIRSTCSATIACGSGVGGSRDIDEWSFVDDQVLDGGAPADAAVLYSTRDVPWPADVFIRVYRTTGAATCGHYQVRVSR